MFFHAEAEGETPTDPGGARSRQLNSELRDRCRLVAMDMRGHGLSEMPRDAYAGSKLWADDINAVLQALKLDRPVLCGWSYGPLVIPDYPYSPF